MAGLSKATLTNLEAGPRGLETAGGLVTIEAGAEARVELSAGELAAAAASGWFAVTIADSEPRLKKRAR